MKNDSDSNNKNEYDVSKRVRKIDLDMVIDDLFKDIEEIDSSDKSQSRKTQSYKRAAQKVIKALYGLRARNKANAISLNTASKYLTKVRNQVSKRGWLHHGYEPTIIRLKSKYPQCIHLLEPIEEQELETTRLRVKALKEKLLQVDRLEKAIRAISLEDTNYKTSINNISKAFPDWSMELLHLKSEDKEGRSGEINKLLSTIVECRLLYNEIGGLKIDHEVMRWLIKDDFASAESAETSASALSTKKHKQ